MLIRNFQHPSYINTLSRCYIMSNTLSLLFKAVKVNKNWFDQMLLTNTHENMKSAHYYERRLWWCKIIIINSLQFFAKWNNFLIRVTQQKRNKTKWMDLNLYWQKKKTFILIIYVGGSAIQECFYWFKARFEYMWKVISL